MFLKPLLIASALMLCGCVDTYEQAFTKCFGNEDCAETRINNQQAVQNAAVAVLAAAAAGAAAGAVSRYSGRPVFVSPRARIRTCAFTADGETVECGTY